MSEYCQDINLSALEWFIKYKREPDAEVFEGPVIATDSESGQWNRSGYSWVRNNLVAALSPDKAIVHTVTRNSKENEADLSIPFDINTHTKITRYGYYDCAPLGRHLQAITILEGSTTREFGYRPIDDTMTELLMFGDVPIKTTSLHKKGSKLPWFSCSGLADEGNWTATTIWEAPEGHCIDANGNNTYDAADCITEEGYWEVKSSIPEYNGTAELQYKEGFSFTYCDGIIPYFTSFYVPFTFKFTQQGEKNIRVLMFDNIEVDSTFILFYSYDTEDWTYNKVGDDYDSVKTTTSHFMKVTRQNGGTHSEEEVATMTKVETSSKHNGQTTTDVKYSGRAILNVATQINAGVISYTYPVFDLEPNGDLKFKERVVGVINVENDLLTEGYNHEFVLFDDDAGLNGFDHRHRASIGIHNLEVGTNVGP